MRVVKKKAKFWHRALQALYNYRSWWVDFPTLSLLSLYHWDFYSRGVHPVPTQMPEFCWIVLAAYWVIKEGVRWKLHGIKSRRGSILVAIWMISIVEFFVMMASQPEIYTMPPNMVYTTLIVLLGFLGILPVKRAFAKKFPSIATGLLPHDDE